MNLLDTIKGVLPLRKRKYKGNFYRYMLVVELEGKGYIFSFSKDLKIVQDLKIEIQEHYSQLLLQRGGLNMLRKNAMNNFHYTIEKTGQHQNHPSIESFCHDNYSIHIIDTAKEITVEPSLLAKSIYYIMVIIFLVVYHASNISSQQQVKPDYYTHFANYSNPSPRINLLDTLPLLQSQP